MNTLTNTKSHYCPGCDTLVGSHICGFCNDYTITIDEATEAGWLMSIAPVDCTCSLCAE